MKKIIPILFLAMLSMSLSAQTYTIERTPSSARKGNLAAPGSLTPVTFTSISPMITFTQITRDDAGNFFAGNLFTIGEAYLWHFANGKFNPDSSITVEQRLSVGFGLNFGVTTSETGQLVGALPVGAIVCWANIGIFGGYDVFNTRPLIGLNLNLPNVPIFKRATKFSKLPRR